MKTVTTTEPSAKRKITGERGKTYPALATRTEKLSEPKHYRLWFNVSLAKTLIDVVIFVDCPNCPL